MSLIVDIETVGPAFADLEEPVREYLLRRARTDEEREKVPERTALELGLARPVAIGMHDVERDVTCVILESASPVIVEGANVVYVRPNEAGLLAKFWKVINAFPRIVTFNGRAYDGPVLMIRSAINRIACERNLVPYRYDIGDHCDLADVLQFQGALRGGYTLDYWCRMFGIPSPKEGGISGSDVGRLYAEGRMSEIGAYVARDVKRTGQLYTALEASLLWTFKNGPRIPAQPEEAQIITQPKLAL